MWFYVFVLHIFGIGRKEQEEETDYQDVWEPGNFEWSEPLYTAGVASITAQSISTFKLFASEWESYTIFLASIALSILFALFWAFIVHAIKVRAQKIGIRMENMIGNAGQNDGNFSMTLHICPSIPWHIHKFWVDRFLV